MILEGGLSKSNELDYICSIPIRTLFEYLGFICLYLVAQSYETDIGTTSLNIFSLSPSSSLSIFDISSITSFEFLVTSSSRANLLALILFTSFEGAILRMGFIDFLF